MDRAGFWTIVDDARSGAQDDKAFMDRIGARLRTLSPQELTQFQTHFEDLHRGSHALELWGAAYIVNGGCSNDGFDYFRAWLIAQGRHSFERVMAAPDTLVEMSGDDVCDLEAFISIAVRIYEETTGGAEMPYPPITYRELGNEDWDFDDREEMKRRYPRLVARYW
jgi:uncharacterized protein DUF4240